MALHSLPVAYNAGISAISNDCPCREVTTTKKMWLTEVPQNGPSVMVEQVKVVCDTPPPTTRIDCDSFTLNDQYGRPWTIEIPRQANGMNDWYDSLTAEAERQLREQLAAVTGDSTTTTGTTLTAQQCANSCQEQLNNLGKELKAEYDKNLAANSDDASVHPIVWFVGGGVTGFVIKMLVK